MLKKLWAYLSAAAVSVALLGSMSANAAYVKANDYTRNLSVTDVTAVQDYLTAKRDTVNSLADLNQDEVIDAMDLALHKQILLGNLELLEPPTQMRDLTASQLLDEITIGWNLGNTLDATTTSWLPNPTPAQSETAWGCPMTTKAMIDKVKEGGFNTVRVPVSWIDHTGSAPEYRIDEAWMNRVQEVVNYVIDNDMYCILNIHHENDWLIPTNAQKDSVNARLDAIWTQIATRFGSYDEHLIFEGMNEPRLVGDPNEWNGGNQEARQVINSYNQTFVNTVRATGGNNAIRCLMVPTYAASCSSTTVSDFVLPTDTVANKLIVDIHSYSPYNFALNTSGTSSFTQSDISQLQWTLQEIYNSFGAKGIPVIIGEFGALNKNNINDRVLWGENYLRIAKSYNIRCIWWDNNAFATSGENFGLLNRGTLTWQYPELLEAMMKGLNS